MCRFEYKKFDACGHCGIEVHEFCEEVLWKAGRYGELQICLPELLQRSLEWPGPDELEPPQIVLFVGYEGFCEICVDQFKIPSTTPQRSYTDKELNYRKPQNIYEPNSLAPYILTRGLFTQIPDLLGISNQFTAAQVKQGPYILFPKILERMTWSELRKYAPFTSRGVFEDGCVLTLDEVLERLEITEGITKNDKDCIFNAMQTVSNLRTFYKKYFKARGMLFGNFDRIVECFRTAATQIELKKTEALKESPERNSGLSDTSALKFLSKTPKLSDYDTDPPISFERDSELSDISTLTVLTKTPELSDYGTAPQNSHSPSQSSILERQAGMRKPQLRDKPEIRHVLDDLRKGFQSKAIKLAQTAIAKQTSQQVKSSSAAKSTSRKSVPTFVDEAGRQRKHTSMNSGNGITTRPTTNEAESSASAQPSPRGSPLKAGEQNLGQTTVTAGNATSSDSTGTYMGVGSWTMGSPEARRAAFATHLAHDYRLSPQFRSTKQAFQPGDAYEFQRIHRAQQLPDTHSSARTQGLQSQQFGEIQSGGTLQSLSNLLALPCPPIHPSVTGIQQPQLLQGSQYVRESPRSHGMQRQPSASPYNAYHQLGNLPAAQNQHCNDQAPRRMLPQETVQHQTQSTAEHPFRPTALPLQPVLHASYGPQQLAYGWPQLPWSSTLPEEPAFSPSFGWQLPQLADGLLRLSQGPSQFSQSMQQPRCSQSRHGRQPVVSPRETVYFPSSASDEERDLQESSKAAWQSSQASRKG
ncbi:hypothetical protein VP1G_02190 [Cytospora mali]|uniref:Uncharacterized protein n=1 Tax=Cytospora mali TaxID=578113 RepID=A0A194UT68_CYTMA|nr:hypothetical protein VP1G_02190 [Valsa mali var. pyri (nom. inval.)]